MTTKAEHLAWSKARALAHLDIGEVAQAVASMVSDLNKHPDTRHLARESFAFLGASMRTPEKLKPDFVRRWIESMGECPVA